jgi:uncharacterized protein (DUF2147 family)
MNRLISPGLLALLLGIAGWASGDPMPGLTGSWVTADGEAVMSIHASTADQVRVVLNAIAPPLVDDDPTPRQNDHNNPDPKLRDRPLAGLELGRLVDSGGNDWRGRLYDPETGNTYRVVARLIDSNVMEMRGYIGIPAFGRAMHWVRLSHHRQRLTTLWAAGASHD